LHLQAHLQDLGGGARRAGKDDRMPTYDDWRLSITPGDSSTTLASMPPANASMPGVAFSQEEAHTQQGSLDEAEAKVEPATSHVTEAVEDITTAAASDTVTKIAKNAVEVEGTGMAIAGGDPLVLASAAAKKVSAGNQDQKPAAQFRWMWGDAGFKALRGIAKKNPGRWSACSLDDLKAELEKNKDTVKKGKGRPVLIDQVDSGSAEPMEFDCVQDALTWLTQTFENP